MDYKVPTTGDVVALLIVIIGLGIGALCLWGHGRIGDGAAIAGMVIGAIIALPPLLFWNIDKQKWQM
jgi:hypothetical protein